MVMIQCYDNYILLGLSINHSTDLGELYMVQMKEKWRWCNRMSRATYTGGDMQERARASNVRSIKIRQ